jgi:hypothetical protein
VRSWRDSAPQPATSGPAPDGTQLVPIDAMPAPKAASATSIAALPFLPGARGIRVFPALLNVGDLAERELAFDAGLFTPPLFGERFVVFDGARRVASGQVTKVQRVNASCSHCGATTHHVVVTLAEGFKATRDTMAVGPESRFPPGATVRVIQGATDLAPAADVRLALDLDGDNAADVALVSSQGDCREGPPRPAAPRVCDFIESTCEGMLRKHAGSWLFSERVTRGVCGRDARSGHPL